MDWYYYIALAAIASQLLFLLHTYSNYHFAVKTYKRERSWYRPRTVLIIPCKGLDSAFQQNITSFFNQDYENYLLWFVVGDESDPAYDELCQLKTRLNQSSKAQDVQVFVAGHGQTCSQKIHNLLYCYERITDDDGRAWRRVPVYNGEKLYRIMGRARDDIIAFYDPYSHPGYQLRYDGTRWNREESGLETAEVVITADGTIMQITRHSAVYRSIP